MTKRQPIILTIGHSNHPLDHFFHLLHAHAIELLVDVRSHPYSRFFPHFNKARLETTVTEAGLGYRFFGDLLGGKPDDDRFYDSKGHVLYGLLARSPHFLHGIDELVALAGRHRVAIMCAEEDPSCCHRRLLITPVLLDCGLSVLHIRRDSSLLDEDDLRRSNADNQSSLFDHLPDSAWKSAKPIRPQKK